MKTASVLNVFLASPSDLATERAMAEEVVTSINKTVGQRLGWRVDLHKWEDTPPGFGRPQALINPKVDECDLFVGILWERWGEPSGSYSSGFEEEYERAKARRKVGGKPEIWLFFKNIDASKLRDPGDQLKKVLDFRNSQKAHGELLFREVHEAEKWKFQFHESLISYVLGLALPSETVPQQPVLAVPSPSPSESSEQEPSAQENLQDAVPQQLKQLSALLGTALESRVPEFFDAHESGLQEFDVARLYLISATLMSRRYTTEILGTHDINLLYKHRQQLDATTIELYQLFRTMVEDPDDVKPGWFWFRWAEEEAVRRILIRVAFSDSSQGVRARALDCLAAARIEIPQELWPSLPVAGDSFELQQSAFNYLAALGNESSLSYLDKLTDGPDPRFSDLRRDARFKILAGLDPGRALSELIAGDEYISEERVRPLLANTSGLPEQPLLEGTKSSSETIRKLCLEELSRREKLPVSLAQQFIKDPSLAVRAVVLQDLAAQRALADAKTIRGLLTEESQQRRPSLALNLLGRLTASPSPDVDSIIVAFYRAQRTEDVLAAVDWFSVDGHLAYRALALDRFDSISTDLRSDLANGFSRVKEESLKRVETEFGPESSRKLNVEFEQLDEFIRSQFAEAALLGLAKNPQPGDAELARPYLARGDHSGLSSAVTVVSKTGNSGDADTLLRIAKQTYGEVQAQAAAGALKLAANPVEFARQLLLGKGLEAASVAFQWMLPQDSREVRIIFDELLRHTEGKNRVRAVHYFSKHLPNDELQKLLETYIGQDAYYYNVVTWLDRLLYSPSPLRQMFISHLEQKAD